LRLLAAVLAGAALLVLAAPAGAERKPQRKTVRVGDNFFSPTRLTVNPRSAITWRWPREGGGDVHDVKLVSAPRGERKFESESAASEFEFRRRLRRAGLYRFVCTFHQEEMTMTIRVRRP
jgi:plastocyanin